MKLKTIKTIPEIKAAIEKPRGDRPHIELVVVDKSIKEVRIGGFHISGSYGLSIHAEQPFEEDKRWRLTATAPGFPAAVSFHTYEHEANAAAAKFGEGTETKVEGPFDVQIDDNGHIVGYVSEADAAAAAALINLDDVPF